MFSICFYSMSSCRWVIHQSVTPKAFVSPSSSTKTSFHPSLSDSLLSSLPFSLCHLSYRNFIRVCFLAIQHPSNTSGPFHYISPARNELRSEKVQSIDVRVYLLQETSSSAKFQLVHTSFIRDQKGVPLRPPHPSTRSLSLNITA